jgi:hypothetical protein
MFRQDVNNVSPRAGLAYEFAPGWVLRAGYGIFFDRYVLANLNRAVQKDGPTAFEQVVYGDAAATAFQTAGGSLLAPIGGLRPSIYRADAGLGTPYSQQTSFSMEHLVARDLTASASYLFVRGVKLPRTRNINLVMPGPAFGPSRAYPRFDNIYQLENSASSTYQGVSFSVNRRMSSELEFSASYTLSKTFDDASDFDEQPQNPFNLKDERALSLQRQQQRLVFSSLWELPIGDEEAGKPAEDNWITRVFGHIEVAPIFTVESGRPVNPLTGVDSTRSGAFPLSSRPQGFGRNSLRSPMLANMDFRALKYRSAKRRVSTWWAKPSTSSIARMSLGSIRYTAWGGAATWILAAPRGRRRAADSVLTGFRVLAPRQFRALILKSERIVTCTFGRSNR